MRRITEVTQSRSYFRKSLDGRNYSRMNLEMVRIVGSAEVKRGITVRTEPSFEYPRLTATVDQDFWGRQIISEFWTSKVRVASLGLDTSSTRSPKGFSSV